MRIIAGEFRSRRLKTLPGDNTRPTLDKVRESFFHKIGPYFQDGLALDLYGGSGAVGLEALSRGIEQVYFSEISKPALSVIRENIRALGVEQRSTVLAMSDLKALRICKERELQFDFIYLDPPYHYRKLGEAIQFIDQALLLSEKGVCLVETAKEEIVENRWTNLVVYETVIYGISKISFLKRKEEDADE